MTIHLSALVRKTAITLASLLALGALAATAPAADAAKRDRGDFKLSYGRAPADARTGMTVLRRYTGLRSMVRELNAGIRLPRNVRVVVGRSGGPYYDPQRRTIVMSPDFTELVVDMFARDDPSASAGEIRRLAGSAAEFVFLHEVGHALVDQLGIPITGREEDAVDGLAAVLMAEVFEDTSGALAASYLFGLFGQERDTLEASDFFDEHSLDEQRFFSILCHVYGSDPAEHEDLVRSAGMPDERLAGCQAEYGQLLRSWTRLLRRHLK